MSDDRREFLHQLFRRYARQVGDRLAPRFSEPLAMEALHEAYLRLAEHPNLGAIRHPRAYLLKTASNLALDALRRERVRLAYTESRVEPEALRSPAPDPEAAAENQLAFERFLVVLDGLPALCRHAFLLNKLEGLTHPEIAEQLGISKKTVQRYLLRALPHLSHNCRLYPCDTK